MEIRCPCCQVLLALADRAVGKRALCPSCRSEFRVPELQPLVEPSPSWSEQPPLDPLVRCPACERTLAYEPALAGQAIICPTCGRRLRMPAPGESVVDLGTASTRPAFGRPTSTAVPTSFPEQSENPYASGPILGPLPPQATAPYAAAGVMLMILSASGLIFGSVLFCLAFIGAIVLGAGEALLMLLVLSLAVVSHGLTIAGGLQMVRRRNLLLARVGAWAALYPCGMFSIFQVPFAIWALVLLYRANAPADFSPTSGGDVAQQRGIWQP